MSPKLRRLSGNEVIRIFESLGFDVISNRGSHAKLKRISDDNKRQIITIPLHKEIDVGTLKAIYRQALKYIPKDQLRKYFYTE